MTPDQFLRYMWPDEGPYCVVVAKPRKEGGIAYYHHTTNGVAAAVQYLEMHNANSWFTIFNLHEKKVWNPKKINAKTGEAGAYEWRTKSNMKESRAFFFDLDVGASKDGKPKYISQKAALEDLKRFCLATELPRPFLVSSGNGVHVYWRLDDAIPADEWVPHAAKLRQLALHFKLLIDTTRTTDVSSVLRVVGTMNTKPKLPPKPVEVIAEAKSLPTSTFTRLLDDAVVRAGIDIKPAYHLSRPVVADDTSMAITTLPPVSLRAIATGCAQMRHFVEQQGNVSEPEWYAGLGVTVFVRNADVLVHKLSEGHPDYNPDEVDRKVSQIRERQSGATTCAKMADVFGPERCEQCRFASAGRSPIYAGMMSSTAPPPLVVKSVDGVEVEFLVPEAPEPYRRSESGQLFVTFVTKAGVETDRMFYENDLYPVRRIIDRERKVETHEWCVVLPRIGKSYFTIDADALYDRRKFTTSIANSGVFPMPSNLQHMQDYMTAYISKLQQMSDPDLEVSNLGWTDTDLKAFVMPDKIFHTDGKVTPANLNESVLASAQAIRKEGTLAEQVRLLQFFNHPAYIPHQMMILASLVSPFFHATGLAGVVINATGETGAGKSTALYAAASLWGHPRQYPLDGTSHGATLKGRQRRLAVLGNLPGMLDEVTYMQTPELSELVMTTTQFQGGRIILRQDSSERTTTNVKVKASILLTTANSSLHNLLSFNNIAGAAGSMRVIELRMRQMGVHTKAQADLMMRSLTKNFGHIGEALLSYIVTNVPDYAERIVAAGERLYKLANGKPAERFWIDTCGALLFICEAAYAAGLLSFQRDAIENWMVKKMFPMMRATVRDEYASSLSILSSYLDSIDHQIIVTTRHTGNVSTTLTVRAPHGPLMAHLDLDGQTMWVARKGFQDYCRRVGANYHAVVQELAEPSGEPLKPIVIDHNARKVLGKGTDHAKAQTWCFVINVAHPEVAGDEVFTTLARPAGKPQLSVVE